MNNRLVKDTKADRVFMGFNYIFVILSVAIVLYEALRQNHFDHMKLEGQLHRLKWED